MTKNLLFVSNRLPVNVKRSKNKLIYKSSIGGLATALSSFHKLYNCTWVGWPGIALSKIKKEKSNIEAKFVSEFNCYPIFLSQRDIDSYYYGFCNRTIWPLFHYFTQYTIYDNNFWESYRSINNHYCNLLINIIRPDDIIWIHDFHLMLLPRLLREKLPDATIGFFLHIPFPSFELFRLLPWRKHILNGLLGADLIGFHTYDYVRHFLSSVHRLLGFESQLGQIIVEDRIIKVDSFPIGIDYERFSKSKKNSEIQKEITNLKDKIENQKIVFSIDRLDYTKGILQRLEAFDLFLNENPAYKNKMIFIFVVVPSRINVERYRELKRCTDEIVGRINGKHGNIGWTPVWYLSRQLTFNELVALYNVADVALITPLRDGMNLVAKEYVATKTDGRGVLILSETAGAAKELGEAIIVNANDKEKIASALKKALQMSEHDQIKHNRLMQNRLQRYNVYRWANDFMDALTSTKELQKESHLMNLDNETRQKLIYDCHKSKKRLFLLDYDGTLIHFFENPKDAKPTTDILKLLTELADYVKNDVVLISGRVKDELESWFNNPNLGLVAEHGTWIKENNRTWKMIEPLADEWKNEIRPILELYLDRTPGAFIEEKEFSLAWHYRKADSSLGTIRARELVDILVDLTANYNLQVLEGSKVIEIRNSDINKGRATLRWISKENWDFILAIGDDLTDEDLFAVLPESANSIKVGLDPSQAKFRIKTPSDVRLLLKDMIKEC